MAGQSTSLRESSAATASVRRSGPGPPPAARPSPVASSGRRYQDDDLLTVADAAVAASRSERTLRRADLAGTLIAHRDGNGRGVTLRYGDLRAWLTAEVIARPTSGSVPRPIGRVDGRPRASTSAATGNAELLEAALERRRRRARAAAAPRRAGRP